MTVTIALVGDYNPNVTAHQAIPKALELAAENLGLTVTFDWVATSDIDCPDAQVLDGYSGIWCVPASPYQSFDGALAAIRRARENQIAFLGTCGGYQHAILEYARNVLGLADAANAEIDPDASLPLIAPLSCALIDQDGGIDLAENSVIRKVCGAAHLTETYRCSFGFNPEYAHVLDGRDLRIVAWDQDRDPRAIELRGHPFFIGTAFQPERAALRGEDHPLINAFVRAAAG
ncbi:MAG: CTP synthase [Thalassospira sp.]|uniref:CTP synthase C-terminal region-related (seleno)protein n=1 Tax=Thalassospira sp. TaxID=1912094 RepID=UPI001B2A6E7A|nr:CTP synthase [Thalassospira sp.]MBO6579519.1 CTP synthase [Thalassospira sp.]MBO6802243.1 CTP synthase [Thalassospira sp.]MBO6816870.1 CTP synthase [Thalassospira sp.]MBO6888892.1 CTP synthase [Thalassospira sp.]